MIGAEIPPRTPRRRHPTDYESVRSLLTHRVAPIRPAVMALVLLRRPPMSRGIARHGRGMDRQPLGGARTDRSEAAGLCD